jgi:hypothetical protein
MLFVQMTPWEKSEFRKTMIVCSIVALLIVILLGISYFALH